MVDGVFTTQRINTAFITSPSDYAPSPLSGKLDAYLMIIKW